jgi:hypothetical protein
MNMLSRALRNLEMASSQLVMEVQVFQHSGGRVMGVFRLSDPRPGKVNAYSAAMPIVEALDCALKVARSRSADIVIDDPHGRLFWRH